MSCCCLDRTNPRVPTTGFGRLIADANNANAIFAEAAELQRRRVLQKLEQSTGYPFSPLWSYWNVALVLKV